MRIYFLTVLFLVFSSCTNQVEDKREINEEENHHNSDSGLDNFDETESIDGGENNTDQNEQDDAGVSDNDSGVAAVGSEYAGEAEEGVRCGENLQACGLSSACCVEYHIFRRELSGSCHFGGCPPSAGSTLVFPIQCDGQEDCQEGTRCCADLSNINSAGTRCRQVCVGQEKEVCHTSADCFFDELCCTAKLGIDTTQQPIDVGVCFRTESCADVDLSESDSSYGAEKE